MRTTVPKSTYNLAFHRGEGCYKLYWIHTDDHTCPKTQGYVGITKRSLSTRMNAHMRSAYLGKNYTLSNAIRNHKDLVVDILCFGDENYIRDLENKLRPDMNIGWNIREGGEATVSELMKGLWSDPEYRQQRVAERVERYKKSPEAFKPLFDAAREYAQSEEGRQKCSETMQKEWTDPERRAVRMDVNKRAGKSKSEMYNNVGRWMSSKTKHHVWEKADELYEIYLEDPTVSRKKFADKTPFTQNEVECMFRKYFKQGWNPNEDEKWVSFYREGGRHVYGK